MNPSSLSDMSAKAGGHNAYIASNIDKISTFAVGGGD